MACEVEYQKTINYTLGSIGNHSKQQTLGGSLVLLTWQIKVKSAIFWEVDFLSSGIFSYLGQMVGMSLPGIHTLLSTLAKQSSFFNIYLPPPPLPLFPKQTCSTFSSLSVGGKVRRVVNSLPVCCFSSPHFTASTQGVGILLSSSWTNCGDEDSLNSITKCNSSDSYLELQDMFFCYCSAFFPLKTCFN